MIPHPGSSVHENSVCGDGLNPRYPAAGELVS